MYRNLVKAEFQVIRDNEKCIRCRVCERQCSFEVHSYDAEADHMREDEMKCVGCQRCVEFCPTRALIVRPSPSMGRPHANWTYRQIKDICKQADTGGMLLTGCGDELGQRIYWDHLVLNASQVTNPSIDPLREPMELRTYIGRKPDKLEFSYRKGVPKLKTKMPPQLKLDLPIMFGALSYGAISYNVCESLARAATDSGTMCNTGEGGLHKNLYKYGPNTIVQCASGRFGVTRDYLNAGAAIEIKIGQGAKPGIGGHLPGEKVDAEISVTRMIPEGTDALSPAPHHDIYSIEDLRQLVFALKEAVEYSKPVGVKIAAVHNAAAIASGIVRAGADFVTLDGLRGGTGAAPTRTRDNVGMPIELALAAVDQRLRDDGLRNQASLLVAGGFRNSADIIKAIALGADAVYIGTSALIAVGCTVCQKCYTGKCPWGITTQDPYLSKRVNPDMGARRLNNLLRAWSLEIKEMLGGMGINAIESLRGNRLHLRAVGLSREEMDILGVMHAGE
ncbi:MAG: glutamate synthase-related protein [Thermoleophilia bacterium]